ITNDACEPRSEPARENDRFARRLHRALLDAPSLCAVAGEMAVVKLSFTEPTQRPADIAPSLRIGKEHQKSATACTRDLAGVRSRGRCGVDRPLKARIADARSGELFGRPAFLHRLRKLPEIPAQEAFLHHPCLLLE